MKKALLFLAILLLAGCAADPISTDSTTNSNGVSVQVIAKDSDGCVVKRFQDAGYYHYYVTGCGGVTTSGQVGKSTFEEIQTTH